MSVKNLVRFFESVKEMGVDLIINEDEKEVYIKGKLKYMDFSEVGYNIEIFSKNIIIGYTESYDLITISVWRINSGRQTLLRKVSLKGKFFTLYESPYLRINYRKIGEFSELLFIPNRVDEIINEVRKAGFNVKHYPGKRIIKVRGEIDRITPFGHPRPFIRLREGGSTLIYEKAGKDHYIAVISNSETKYYKIGEGEEVTVMVDYPYLIIRYSEVS